METKYQKDRDIPEDFTGIAVFPSGTRKHFKNGLLHRVGGPAIEWSTGAESYYFEGLHHRRDGPAFKISEEGKKKWKWYLHGKEVTAEEVFDQMTDDEKEKAAWEINKWQ